ncbi:FecR domain-containing protein [Phaeodactylibacter luteus]|nr:FecR domain-containing protein [Phaeodactylibacter luteus]
MNLDNYHDLIGRYLADEISAEERVVLRKWVEAQPSNQAFFEEARQLWQITAAYEDEPFSEGRQAAWAKLQSRIDSGSPGGRIVPMQGRRNWLRYAAAVLALIAGTWLVVSEWGQPAAYAEFATGPGERSAHLLPDGSVITLNENSRLQYPERFQERAIILEGEAYFDVARDERRPFVIQAKGATTTVLGTSFNIRAYPEEETVTVAVASGRVVVAGEQTAGAPVTLTAGESAIYELPTQRLGRSEVSNPLAWKSRSLAFEQVKMETVAQVLGRYYGVSVRLADESLASCRFVGAFEDPTLEEVLDAIAFTMGVTVEQDKDSITLSGLGCE